MPSAAFNQPGVFTPRFPGHIQFPDLEYSAWFNALVVVHTLDPQTGLMLNMSENASHTDYTTDHKLDDSIIHRNTFIYIYIYIYHTDYTTDHKLDDSIIHRNTFIYIYISYRLHY